MNDFEYFLQKFRKALGEHSPSAFQAGTKALAERNCLRTCQEGNRRRFGEGSSIALLAGKKAHDDLTKIRRLPSYLPGRQSPNVRRLLS